MRLLLTAPRSELGRVLAAMPSASEQGGPPVIVNLALQAPNTLLHDGRAWWRDAPAHILASTRRVLAAARREEAFVLHASYAFLQAAESGGRVGETLGPIVAAAREAEEMVLDSDVAARVVRLGYLYGPRWRDMRAYRRAFQLRRPYWAGPRHNLQHHLHADDAAQALLTAAQERAAGTRSYATDSTPASFADFMDHFAHLVGRARPLHIPRQARLLVRPVVRAAHMEMVELASTGAAAPRLRGWSPTYRDHHEGLAQVVGVWAAER